MTWFARKEFTILLMRKNKKVKRNTQHKVKLIKLLFLWQKER